MHSIDASIRVDAPVDYCYQAWMDFEKFPSFMSRVVSVHCLGPSALLPPKNLSILSSQDPQLDVEGVVMTELLHEMAAHGNRAWHWEVKGPLGQIFEWTAGIVQDEPNKMVSWATLPEEELPNTGTVNFLKAPDSRTNHDRSLITVTMSFSVPAGALGELLSDIVGYGDTLLNEALTDFKNHVETNYTIERLEQG